MQIIDKRIEMSTLQALNSGYFDEGEENLRGGSEMDNTVSKNVVTAVPKPLAERWPDMSLAEQLANVGSEFGRAAKRKEKGEREKELKFFEKGLELLDMSIASAANKKAQHPGIFRELARLREVMCDYFVGDNEYGTDRAFIDKYFYDFAYCCRKNRG